MRKDHRRHEFVRDLGGRVLGLAAEQAVGQPPPGRDRHGGQLHQAAHVPERVDVAHVGVLILVRDDVPLGRDRDAAGFQFQPLGVGDPLLGVGLPAGRHEDDVGSLQCGGKC